MKPGPAAKPVELKALEGGRGHRPLNLSGLFRPEVGLPAVPKGLSPGARKVWKRLSPLLLRYNLMSEVYADTFEELCECVAEVKEMRHAIRARQAVLRGKGEDPTEVFEARSPGGMPVQHPRYQIYKSERQEMIRLLGLFGLNPSAQDSVTTAIRAHLSDAQGQLPGMEKPGTEASPPKPTGWGGFK